MKPIINTKFAINILFCFMIMLSIGCSEDDGPTSSTVTDYTGTWSGSIEHPGYDGGSLSVAMVESDSISGTYTMRLTEIFENNGRARVTSIDGPLVQAKRGGLSSISFTLSVSGSLWDFTGTAQNNNSIAGNWQSRNRSGIAGTFQISR